MKHDVIKSVEVVSKSLAQEVLAQERYEEAERLLEIENERQNDLSNHAADLSLVYTDKLTVYDHTGRTRDQDDTVYYRSTPWLLSEEYSNDGVEVSFSVKNEGYEESPGPYSVINMRLQDSSGHTKEHPFATVGDANVDTGFDNTNLNCIRGAAIFGDDETVLTDEYGQTLRKMAWHGTKEFESIKNLLNWMSVEYAKNK